MTGPFHFELVAKDGEFTVYVTDHAGDNMLKGTGTFTINQDTGIMVFLKLPEQEAYAARFTPLGQKQLSDKKG